MKTPQYITQITKEWLARVSRQITGGLFIKTRETNESVALDLDVDNLRSVLNIGTGTVTSVDGHSPTDGAVSFGLTGGRMVKTDSNGHLESMGALAGSKWMKTDGSGMPSTTNDTPATVGSSTPSDVSTSSASSGSSDKAARSDHVHKLPTSVITTSDIAKARLTSLGNGMSSRADFVASISWNGTTLSYQPYHFTFSNGVMTDITADTVVTIDTPVPYSGS